MRVALASDHAGFALKERIKTWLGEFGVDCADLGPADGARVDYPDFAVLVGRAVVSGAADAGILVCGTGIGMSIAANKVPGVRAALLTDVDAARLSRQHNDANVMTIGGRTVEPALAREIVRTFLQTAFEGGRHQRRVEKIAQLETSPSHPGTPAS